MTNLDDEARHSGLVALGNLIAAAEAVVDARLTESTTRARCGACKNVKPAADFHKDNARPNGLFWKCKACVRDSDRKKREVARLNRIRLGEEIMREAAAAGRPITAEEERRVMEAMAARGEQKRQRALGSRLSAEELAAYEAARKEHWQRLQAACTPEIIARNLAESRECQRRAAAECYLRQQAAREDDPEKADELRSLALAARAAWRAIEQLWADRMRTQYPDLNFG
jgi:hypothetical protein